MLKNQLILADEGIGKNRLWKALKNRKSVDLREKQSRRTIDQNEKAVNQLEDASKQLRLHRALKDAVD